MLPLPQCVCKLIDGATVPVVYSMFEVLGYANDTVIYQHQQYRVKDLVDNDEVSWLMAHEMKICIFWGGPPNKLAWYRGTLKTLLLDRIYDFLNRNSMDKLLDRLGLPV